MDYSGDPNPDWPRIGICLVIISDHQNLMIRYLPHVYLSPKPGAVKPSPHIWKGSGRSPLVYLTGFHLPLRTPCGRFVSQAEY